MSLPNLIGLARRSSVVFFRITGPISRLPRALSASAGLLAALFVLAGNGLQAQTAQFVWADTALVGGFSSPVGVAVDPSGNVYVADSGTNALYEVMAVNGSIPASPTVRTVVSGFTQLSAVAVDSSGNLYAVDESAATNGRVYKYLAVDGSVPASPTVVTVGSGFVNPFAVAVDSSQNAWVVDGGGATGVKEVLASGGYTTVTAYASSITSPKGITVDSANNIYVTSPMNTGTIFEILESGGYASVIDLGYEGRIGNSQGVAVDSSGDLFAAYSGDITYGGSLLTDLEQNGVRNPATSFGTSESGGNFVAVTVSQSGNVFVADQALGQLIEFARPNINFNSAEVNAVGSTPTWLTFRLLTGGKLGSVAVLTDGAPSKDFSAVSGGSGVCTAGSVWSSGDFCVVKVLFTPQSSGIRNGAVTLSDSTGNLIATVYLQGVGIGPQIAYSPSTQTNIVTGLNAPEGLAIDSANNIYVAAPNNNAPSSLYEYSPNGSGGWTLAATISTALNNPASVAVDGAGNLFVANYGGNVDEYSFAGGKWARTATVSSANNNYGIAIDGSGNVYLSSQLTNDVREYTLINGAWTQTATVATGLGGPFGISLDSGGNVYVVDNGNADVVEYSLVNGSWKKTATIASGLDYPFDVAVDASGSVFVTSASGVKQYALVGSTWTSMGSAGTGWSTPEGVALDSRGNIYVTDWGLGTIVQLDCSDAPSLSFDSTIAGFVSSDSPKTVQVRNIGNAPLNFSSVSYPADFPEAAGVANACTGSTILAPTTDMCNVPVEFAPLTGVYLSEDVILTDNALNVTGAQQMIAVSGTGIPKTAQTITFKSIPGGQIVNTSITLSATSTSGLAVGFLSSTPSVCTVSQSGGVWSVALNTWGQCSIEASQWGNATYAVAPFAFQNFWVHALTQSISFAAISAPQPVRTSLPLSATATSTLAVSFKSTTPSVCAVLEVAGAWSAALNAGGTCTIEAYQRGNTIWGEAQIVTQSFLVRRKEQAITFPAISEPVHASANGTVTPSATASSGLPVSYVSVHPGICTVTETGGVWVINTNHAGECSIEANQNGNSVYAVAPRVFQSFYIHP
jgi:sugar lactone lactonase YvrE